MTGYYGGLIDWSFPRCVHCGAEITILEIERHAVIKGADGKPYAHIVCRPKLSSHRKWQALVFRAGER